eukprot:scaffold21.g2225.t1
MDPEVEAQLRRERAAQYGRAVRESLAKWHECHRRHRELVVAQVHNDAGGRSARPLTHREPSLTDRLLQRLVESECSECSSDPFSIINLFLEDARAARAAAAAAAAQTAAVLRPQQPKQRAEARLCQQQDDYAQLRACASGSIAAVPVPRPQQQQQQERSGAEVVAAAEAASGGARAHRRTSAVPDGENVPGNVRHRHKRTSSSVLLGMFDAVAEGLPGAGGLRTAGPSLAQQLDVDQQKQRQQEQREEEAAEAGDAGEHLQEGSSKHLYVQEWLQAAEPVPASRESASVVPGSPSSPHDEDGARSEDVESNSAASSVAPQQQEPGPGGGSSSLTVRFSSAAGKHCWGEHQQLEHSSANAASELHLLSSVPGSASSGTASPGSTFLEAGGVQGTSLLRLAAPPPGGSSTTPSASASMRAQHQGGISSPPSQPRLLPLSLSELQRQLQASSASASASLLRTSSTSGSGRSQPVAASSQEQGGDDWAAGSAVLDDSHVDADWPIAVGSAGQQRQQQQPPQQRRFVREQEPELSTWGASGGHLLHEESGQAGAAASGPARMPVAHEAAAPGSPELSASFGDAEISYGDQFWGGLDDGRAAVPPVSGSGTPVPTSVAGQPLAPPPPTEAPRSSGAPPPVPRPSSPPQLLRTNSAGARPGSPVSPRLRPLSPHAADDKYPTPPRSPTHPLAGGPAPAADSAAEALLGATRRTHIGPAALAADGGHSAVQQQQQQQPPGRAAPPLGDSALGDSPAGAATPGVGGLQAEDTFIAHSSAASDTPTDELLRDSPRTLLSVHGQQGEAEEAGAAAGGDSTPASAAPPQQLGQQGEAGNPPRTPPTVTGEPPDESCPGSAVVHDDTVVQTDEHVGGYLAAVLAHFWERRTAAFLRGEEPLELEGFLTLEHSRPACGDPQARAASACSRRHIFNKLLWDAANEALAAHYSRTLSSFAGRLAPERALLDRGALERAVLQRVAGWAALGCGPANLAAVLAEDAAEVGSRMGRAESKRACAARGAERRHVNAR